MFAITQAERARRRHINSIHNFGKSRRLYINGVVRLMKEVFQLSDEEIKEQDSTWNAWLHLKRQESRDLLELLQSDVRDVFKAQALTILLVPRIKFAPFEWIDDTSLNDYLFLSNGVVLSELSAQLRIFAFELLKHNIDTALAPNADKELSGTLSHYNRYVLEALTLLGENDPMAADLFSRYQINDPVEYWNMEDASGYNPFRRILLHTGIAEKWKRLADEMMRKVVRTELEGYVQPRNDWEKALACYTNHIRCFFYNEEPQYSTELFVSQVDFILSLPCISGNELLCSIYVPQIMRMLGGENHKNLRHRFARRLALEGSGYRIVDKDNLFAVYLIRKEFADIDLELRDCLDRMLAEGEARLEVNRRHHDLNMERVNLVMTQMR